jgi:uncharacterized protein (DUF2141 family)
MKRRILFVTLAVVLFGSMVNSQTLNLEVRGFEKISGVLFIGFYNSSDTFLKKSVFGMKLNVSDKNMTIPCTGLAAGTYAISLYQDENGNNTLDKGAFGIPQEKYGFSNSTNAYGPPSFDKSKFGFRKDTTVIIDLH